MAKRSEVDKNLTWDLNLIYPSHEDMEKDMLKAEALADEIVSTYKGKLIDAKTINECLDKDQELSKILVLVMHYVSLAVSVDYYDQEAVEDDARYSNRMTAIATKLSFVNSELLMQPVEVLEEAASYNNGNSNMLKKLIKQKPHTLSPETEKVLTSLSQTLNAPESLYSMAKMADMRFPDFEVNGVKYPLGYSLFEDDYEYDSRTDVRRKAFDTFYSKLREYENTTAAIYDLQIRTEKTIANARNYPSVFDYLLDDQDVTREMYDRQIDIIMKELAPHMRKYAKLLQRIHKLDKMTFADLKTTVDPEYDPKVTIEGSKEYIMGGLKILGENYMDMVKEAYRDRWVDFAKNEGKSTGGFCASPYGRGSFILLTWNERMADVFTLAHELGHAGHFRMCNSAQSINDTNVSTYFVEAPSTMNELLMTHHLLSTSDDKRFKRWVLASIVGNTYYHNFVTHFMEAAYQRKVYTIIDNGGSVQAPVLDQLFKETLQEFWGDAVEIVDGAELTWMRQSHYYMGLYSYTYSAGLTIATQVYKRIEKEGAAAVEDWKKALAAGSTLSPVEFAKAAGVDITTDQALKDTIQYIGELIDEIIRLTDELEA